MPHELRDAKITHISLVDKGANGVPFAIIKEEGTEPVQKSITIAKSDTAKQIVYGVVYQPDAVDAHGDLMTAEEIEKAAHGFMESKSTYNIDKQHDLEADEGYIVESFIVPCDLQLGEQTIVKGSWVAGVKVTNTETWEAIEKGEITGFSMWGIGKRVKVDDAPSNADETPVEKGLLHAITKAIADGYAAIKKGTVRERFEREQKARSFWEAWSAFESSIRRYNWQTDRYEFETDPDTIRDAVQDLSNILQEVLSSDNIAKALGEPPAEISKAGRKISAARVDKLKNVHTVISEILSEVEDKEESDMKLEDIQKALEPLAKQVETLTADVAMLKKEEVPPADPTDEVAKALEPITKALGDLAKDVQLIKSARGMSAQPTDETQIQKEEGSLFAGKL